MIKHVFKRRAALAITVVLCALALIIASPRLNDLQIADAAPAVRMQVLKKSPIAASAEVASTTLLKGDEFNALIPSSVEAIVFTDVSAPDGAFDVSSAKDKGVVAWLSGTTCFVSTQRAGLCVQANANSSRLFCNKPRLESIDLSMLRTDNVNNMFAMFACCPSLKSLDLSKFNTSNVTNMGAMFSGNDTYGDTVLTELDLSSFDTSRVENMSFMFNHCTKLTSLNISSFDTSRVKTMKGMFQQSGYGQTSSLAELDVSHFDTSSVTDMGWMFYGLSKLRYVDVSGFDTSKVVSMHHMFSHSRTLSGLDVSGWDVSNVKTLNAAFHSTAVTMLDLRGWDTSACESFAQMFESNMYLTDIIGIEKLDTSSGKNFYEMFKDCAMLEYLDISKIDTSCADDEWIDPYRGTAADAMTDMFKGMLALKKIKLGDRFSFNGGDKCASYCGLPMIFVDCKYGSWYDTHSGTAYNSASVPNNRSATYTIGPALTNYYVIFDANGAQGYVEAQIHEVGRVYVAPNGTYIHEGFVFTGWNTAADGTGISYMPGDELKNLTAGNSITLYAQWEVENREAGTENGNTDVSSLQKAPISSLCYTVATLLVFIAAADLTLAINKRLRR